MKGVTKYMKNLVTDDLFYVCIVIEFVARSTHNHVRDIVNRLSDDDVAHQIKAAPVNHCLSMEQVCDEWIEDYLRCSYEEGYVLN
ncbi:hypothetical protein DW650_17140 [Roseburia sp. AM23-20]|jgi:hypothetical protein|nr:hypothetical protein DW650_17140 [Roseburia sp. AM23-20]